MAFTESLTVRILGDSSQLKAELQEVVRDLGSLQSLLDQATGVGDRVRDGFGGASGAIRPLEELSQLIGRIVGQVGQLNQTPISLNVEPALQSLGQLSQAIQSVAAQLAALAVMPIGGGPVGPAGGGLPIRAFAEGGFVTGPAGRDVIPSLLSAGEFVLSRETTAVLGSEFLETLNGVGAQRTSRPRLQESIVRSQQTTNHFGGITIQVANAGGVNDIVRDLRLQGVQLRNRRG
jgi:hypothetical protein